MKRRFLGCATVIVVATLLNAVGCKRDSRQPGPQPAVEDVIYGCGATFPSDLYEKWIEVYGEKHPDEKIIYRAIGSGGGIKNFIAGTVVDKGKTYKVDFGASDAAMSDEQISEVKRGVQLVPTAAGSIAITYNLPGVSELKLDRDLYVDIFMGKVTSWKDPRIAELNPGVEFPDLTIALAARQDSSGTTFAFTNHLSAVSDEWRDKGPGVGKLIEWPPATMRAKGNDGVAGLIKRSPGTIGYVEYGIAKRAGLQMAALKNKAGEFVLPSEDSGLATLRNAKLPENLRAFFPDPDGA
ncbi:MAG: phosphate ABC transporter substrate-binding protein PstS, partial [Pirellulales bacterium]|nr:phosphate ABC transporter substrate-binding protein PstS [Pirellulales bacterium]